MDEIIKQVIMLGKNYELHQKRVFGILQPDRLLHQFVIGQTGTGKSTFLMNVALQNIASGRGLCLIDPHGDLA